MTPSDPVTALAGRVACSPASRGGDRDFNGGLLRVGNKLATDPDPDP